MDIDITKHVLVPKHEKLSDKEKEEFLKKYNLVLTQLPKILIGDKVLRNMDIKVGDVMKIIRDPSLVEESVYYRVVVDG